MKTGNIGFGISASELKRGQEFIAKATEGSPFNHGEIVKVTDAFTCRMKPEECFVAMQAGEGPSKISISGFCKHEQDFPYLLDIQA